VQCPGGTYRTSEEISADCAGLKEIVVCTRRFLLVQHISLLDNHQYQSCQIHKRIFGGTYGQIGTQVLTPLA